MWIKNYRLFNSVNCKYKFIYVALYKHIKLIAESCSFQDSSFSNECMPYNLNLILLLHHSNCISYCWFFYYELVHRLCFNIAIVIYETLSSVLVTHRHDLIYASERKPVPKLVLLMTSFARRMEGQKKTLPSF